VRHPKERPARQGQTAGRAKNHSATSDFAAAGDPVQGFIDRLEGVKQTGKEQWQARCPAHDDRKPSLSVARGEDGRALVKCQAGCTTADVLSAVGLTEPDLFPQDGQQSRQNAPGRSNPRKIVGKRYAPKDFRQRRSHGKGGWLWKMGDTPRVLYRLPELLVADKRARPWPLSPVRSRRPSSFLAGQSRLELSWSTRFPT